MKEKNLKIDEENLKLRRANNKKKAIIVILVFTLVLVIMVAVFFYCSLTKPQVVDGGDVTEQDTTINVDKITSLKRIVISDVDQIANVDGKEYHIKSQITVDGAFLLIDDMIQELSDMGTVYANYAYVTNKYILFTVDAQDAEKIVYAINKDGYEIAVDDGEYQIHNLELFDDNLKASGHIFCGLDGDCPDKDLIIKYTEETIKVAPIE